MMIAVHIVGVICGIFVLMMNNPYRYWRLVLGLSAVVLSIIAIVIRSAP